MTRFAFVTLGTFSGTNASVFPLLARRFASLEPERFDVAEWIRADRSVLAANLVRTLSRHGPAAFAGRDRFRRSFYRTAYFHSRVRRAMAERAAAHDYAFTFQTQSLFDASVPGLPHFVYTDHTALANAYYPGFDAGTLPADWLRREQEIYDNATVVFTMSEHVSRSLAEHYGQDPGKVECVFAGSNVEATAEPPVWAERHSAEILFVGREWERKGGPTLLKAFSALREAHPEATLLVAGCSPQIEADGVSVLGEVPHEGLAELYGRSGVFCMPTEVEPFGIVFLEALAHGLPVVATRIGAVPDIVQEGETGLLVEPRDAAALAAALARLIEAPETAERFGALGRERVLARYTWPRTVDAMAARVRNVIGEG